jgi:surfeit locus 1 family protein
MRYQFRPSLIPTVAAVLLVAGMTKLGFWQYGKAEQKKALQATYDARLNEVPALLPDVVHNIEDWRYRRIHAKGKYEPRYQIFLDNQVDNEMAGYHVITPFRAEGGTAVLLVDRGWIPVGDRSRLPQIETPAGIVEVTGFAWVPSNKFYELAPPSAPSATGQWQPLWENMDLTRYSKTAPFVVLPFVLRLDASSSAGGFTRNWVKPAERIEMHIGYAWQWWGFSVALVAIWLFVNLKREES